MAVAGNSQVKIVISKKYDNENTILWSIVDNFLTIGTRQNLV